MKVLKMKGDEGMMTADPIADMLTRVRNATDCAPSQSGRPGIAAEERDRPDSARKKATSSTYKLTEEGAKRFIRFYLKYTPATCR